MRLCQSLRAGVRAACKKWAELTYQSAKSYVDGHNADGSKKKPVAEKSK